ncbi:lipoprotein [Spiroplasma culicicola]|uniref:Lipoprotein n=1 Tax=Spiroplasma culicicola AES-1 TaxID=1276246 RepID=W6AGX3_9MOLU|nr:lipoprotein [Spiroplasma culicicola]AHI52939.1 hypothetical protein SCULI_v1c05980 [Spiroplasma culicicola AES-1]
MKKLLSILGSFGMFTTTAVTTSFVVSCGYVITIPLQPRNLEDCTTYLEQTLNQLYELNSKKEWFQKDIQKKLDRKEITEEQANQLNKNNKDVQNYIKLNQNRLAMSVQQTYYSNGDWESEYKYYKNLISNLERMYASDSTNKHIDELIIWLDEAYATWS